MPMPVPATASEVHCPDGDDIKQLIGTPVDHIMTFSCPTSRQRRQLWSLGVFCAIHRSSAEAPYCACLFFDEYHYIDEVFISLKTAALRCYPLCVCLTGSSGPPS